uniref:Retrovirus-related Pol polyprotein from transposon TNT 1-94 n=1 Tax=Tanacetum cinerariifolium TaxID=118510 RepID=A0A699GTF3_TANCI|nr:retrovirus-related Pol polyprotein from transposon TNT 1-94 [Tanacetum cinerariifolium]
MLFIMPTEAGGKDRPPMLAPGTSETTTEGYMENYKNFLEDIRKQLDAKAKAVQIILTGIDNDIYSTVDACPNVCEIWKAIERLKQGESLNVKDLETNLFWEFEKFYHGMACARECQKPKRAKDTAYHKEKILLCKQEEARIQLSVEQVDWRDDTDNKPKDQELEAHYLYKAKIQEVSPDATDNSGPSLMLCHFKREYYYVNHMNAILGVYTKLDEVTNLKCDYLDALEKCQSLENELSKRITTSESFEALSQQAINLELALQQSRRDNSVHRRLWVLKAHDRKSQASKECHYQKGLLRQRAKSHLFFVGQFCDANLEVAFWKSTCYICDLKGNDLITCSRGIDLYSSTLQDTSNPNPIFLMGKASSSQAWLWHHRFSHLNINTINLLSKYDIVTGLLKLKFVKDHHCVSCELGKAKCKSFKTKTTLSSKR